MRWQQTDLISSQSSSSSSSCWWWTCTSCLSDLLCSAGGDGARGRSPTVGLFRWLAGPLATPISLTQHMQHISQLSRLRLSSTECQTEVIYTSHWNDGQTVIVIHKQQSLFLDQDPVSLLTLFLLQFMHISRTRSFQNKYMQADKLNLAILVTCMQVSCAEQSCILLGARNLYQTKVCKKIGQSMTHAQTTCTSRLVRTKVSRETLLSMCHPYWIKFWLGSYSLPVSTYATLNCELPLLRVFIFRWRYINVERFNL